MATNPVNNERVVTVEYQTRRWLAGESIHNGLTRSEGECCPDFSCCFPDLLKPYEERLKYVQRHHPEILDKGDDAPPPRPSRGA